MAKRSVPSLQGARILIVEDEYFIADDLARALRKAGAEPVGPVSTLDHAETLLAREKIDGAIVDINLRGKFATDFARNLSKSRTPCLIVSGYGGDSLPESIGDIPRLEKPVRMEAVMEELAGVLHAGGAIAVQ